MMSNLLDGIEEVLLMGPGPSYIHDAVYEAMSKKTLGHLDPYFLKIMDAIKAQLQQVLNTQNRLTLPISGTGSADHEIGLPRAIILSRRNSVRIFVPISLGITCSFSCLIANPLPDRPTFHGEGTPNHADSK